MFVEKKIKVEAPLRKVYNQWTQFEEFPQFMEGIQQVQQLTDDRLHWRAQIGGETKEWEARIVRQIPDEVVAWQSEEGTLNSGEVLFSRLGDSETEVRVRMEYEPEDFKEQVGGVLGVPGRRVEGDLERFKEFIESRNSETGAWRGEIGDQTPVDDSPVMSEEPPEQPYGPGGTHQPPGPGGQTVGEPGAADLSKGRVGRDERGAMAYGGRGDAGMAERTTPGAVGGLGGEGRGTEAGTPDNRAGTGGLGGEGRGTESSTPSGPSSAGTLGGVSPMRPGEAPLQPEHRGTGADDAASEIGDVGVAGGRGDLNAEDAAANSGLRDRGDIGREGQTTEGLEKDDAGTSGDDRLVDYRGVTRPPAGQRDPGDAELDEPNPDA